MSAQPPKNDTDKDHAQSQPPIDNETDSTHMGATEDQVVRLTPPTEALDKLIDNPYDDNPDIDDELTPG